MTVRLDLLSQLLIAAGPWNGKPLVVGQNLFLYHMPDSCLEGIMMRPPLQGIAINHYIPGYYAGVRLQVIVRAASHEVGNPLSEQAMNALTITQQLDFRDSNGALQLRLNHMLPDTLPIVYPRTPGNTTEWSINFEMNYIQP